MTTRRDFCAAALPVTLGLAGLAATGSRPALAQAWPTKPIRMIVPYTPGGYTDNMARLVGESLAKSLGQPVVYDNKPGANSLIGAGMAASAPPDGYTLVTVIAAHAANPSLYAKMPFDPIGSFDPVTLISIAPLLMAANVNTPFNNVKELIAYAKANPGKLTYASSGAGGSPHMAGEMLRLRTGIDILHVPYKGAAPALTDVIGGTVSMGFKTANGTLPSIESGKLRAIAVAGKERMPQLPNVPTLIELGIPDFEVSSWNGLFAPAGTPQAIIDRLAGVTIPALQSPAIRKQFIDLGSVPVGSTPAEFKQYVHNEVVKWAAVAKAANVTID